ncbi:unnamed protein product [Vitrella brassicaformis CCMP3155]|uniref:Uncharacterized protein n=1 Tax=Vitrella brassicaformis (strain CCMP3155) TaxID=1169540 RepID=A0A0G4EFX3_VITBC|nr:unnamed protein product [Vitrella brassicaformis CCMP3155]|eukprot:CEL94393.1 unnamed protein product [Vitrella brassicaformis CCMP3155]
MKLRGEHGSPGCISCFKLLSFTSKKAASLVRSRTSQLRQHKAARGAQWTHVAHDALGDQDAALPTHVQQSRCRDLDAARSPPGANLAANAWLMVDTATDTKGDEWETVKPSSPVMAHSATSHSLGDGPCLPPSVIHLPRLPSDGDHRVSESDESTPSVLSEEALPEDDDHEEEDDGDWTHL